MRIAGHQVSYMNAIQTICNSSATLQPNGILHPCLRIDQHLRMMELMAHDVLARSSQRRGLGQMTVHIANCTPGPPSGFSWNKARHLPAFSIPRDLPAQVHQPAALPKNGDILFVRLLDRALETLVFGQLASINLWIPPAYVDPVYLWQRSVMHRAEGDYPRSSQLHQLQVVAVIEVAGLVLSDAYGEILAGIVFQIKVWFYLGQGLGFNRAFMLLVEDEDKDGGVLAGVMGACVVVLPWPLGPMKRWAPGPNGTSTVA